MDFFRKLFEKKDKKMFINLFTALAIGIGFIIIGEVFDGGGQNKPKEPQTTAEAAENNETEADYRARVEAELEEIFGACEGVGRIKVMVTFRNEGEKDIAKDIQREQTSGGTAGETQKEETKTLLTEGNMPYIINKNCPEVEGVLITCEGGGNVQVQSDLIRGCAALFGIEANKIEVLKMGGN